MSTKASERRILVTGAGGFVGRHVLSAIDRGVFGNAVAIPAPSGFDLRDRQQVNDLVTTSRPDQVLHLAAQSFVPRSFDNPQETLEINLIGTLHLLQALQASDFDGRLLYVSSGDIYGRVPDEELPVNEIRAPEPRNPYAVSKWSAEQLCLQWERSEGLDVVIARPFNHVGPGQDARFVLPALARQIIEIERGLQKPVIKAGDIDTTRDFTDVRDVVSAYAAILSRGQPGEVYLIASGVERKVRELLLQMCKLAGVEAAIEQDCAKMRPAEQRRMVADSSKLTHHTGWKQAYSIQKTLNDILEDARNNP